MLQEHSSQTAKTASERGWRTHFILNSKGGVGKSWVGSLLVQRGLDREHPILRSDGDATAATLSNVPTLKAKCLQMMREGSVIASRRLDEFVEAAITKQG